MPEFTTFRFLGICMGLQCLVIEFARHVMKWENANSTEFDQGTPYPVVFEMPEHHPGEMGGTMRLGLRDTMLTDGNSMIKQLYDGESVLHERHRHRYEVNPKYVPEFEAAGLKFVGQDVDGLRMECVELPSHPYFIGVQFHPEYQTRPLKPSPVYKGFILASAKKLHTFSAHNVEAASIAQDSESEDEEIHALMKAGLYSSDGSKDSSASLTSLAIGHETPNGCNSFALTA